MERQLLKSLAILSFLALAPGAAPAQPPAAEPPLISRELFFSRPEVLTPLLSPNGRYISAVRPLNGVQNYFVTPIDDPAAWRPVTHYTVRDVRSTDVSASLVYFWTPDSRYLVFLRDDNGNENFHVMRVDVETGEQRDLTPGDGVRAVICQRPASYLGCEPGARKDGKILVGLYDDPKFYSLYLIDVATGARSLVFKNDRFIYFQADNTYTPRLGVEATKDGISSYVRTGKDWVLFRKIGFDELGGSRLINFDPTNTKLRAFDNQGRNTMALIETDIRTKAVTVRAEDPQVDLNDEIVAPGSGKIQGYVRNWTEQETIAIDPAIEADIAHLHAAQEGTLTILSRSADDKTWLVRFMRTDAPATIWRFERPAMTLTKLFVVTPKLEGLPLSKTNATVMTSSDRLPLVSFLSLPRELDPDQDGKPIRPVPMVVLIHGGPSDERAEMVFAPFIQWMNNRGYGVYNMNYRGSPGFGKKFMAAQNLEWGGKMNRDVDEQVEKLIADKIADPKRIAAMGGSFGGLATLTAITQRPDLYSCGVDLVGPSDLETFIHNMPPEWSVDEMAARLGDPRTVEGRALLHDHSPIYHADRVKGPVLITQGANDRRVPVSESQRMVDALKGRVPVTYLFYPDEGHGVLRLPNVASYNAITEVFLAKCLGGRAQPLGDVIQNSSVQAPVGASLIPGLAEALAKRDAPH